MAGRGDFDSIPVIDLDGEPDLVAAQVRDACVRVGFFAVRGHGVPAAVVEACLAAARRFFALPLEAKMGCHLSRSAHHRGYGGLGEEQTDAAGGRDLHEAFDLSLDVPADDPEVLAGRFLVGPNQWPSAPAEFRPALEEYYEAMLGLGRRLFEAFAQALGLERTFFAPMLTRPGAFMRVLRYPSQPPRSVADGPEGIGIGAHSDYECFTILAQDEVGGLEVRNARGSWVAVPPRPGCFVINVGDMMARWSNDRFASTLHRVINRSGRERLSIPFFHGVDYASTIAALPGCLEAGEVPRHAPVNAHDYVAARLAETYAKPVAAEAG